MMKMLLVASVAVSCTNAVACVGTTGADIVDFDAAAAGPPDAVAGESLPFVTDRGFSVELTRAELHVGAVYLDQALPVSGAQNTSCILPGTYVAEVTDGIDVDLLNPAPQRFLNEGHGTTLEARAGQVWLTHDDVNATVDPSGEPVLSFEGTATVGGEERHFTGEVSISSNRLTASSLAGANPICKQRIVSPITTLVSVEKTGALLLRIDPRLFFTNVDFAALVKSGDDYVFSDAPAAPSYTQPSVNLYSNLHSGGSLAGPAPYTFSWTPRL
jgi:hypothetical protein